MTLPRDTGSEAFAKYLVTNGNEEFQAFRCLDEDVGKIKEEDKHTSSRLGNILLNLDLVI